MTILFGHLLKMIWKKLLLIEFQNIFILFMVQKNF